MLKIASEDLAYAESLGIEITLKKHGLYNIVLCFEKDTTKMKKTKIFCYLPEDIAFRTLIDEFNDKFNWEYYLKYEKGQSISGTGPVGSSDKAP